MTFSGKLPGKLPGRFTGIVNVLSNVRLALSDNIPGDLPGSFNDYPSGTIIPVNNVGWEIVVRDNINIGLLALVPHYESLTFMPSLNDIGSGEIVIDLSDEIFSTITAQGGPGTDILAKDNIWQAAYNGEVVFEWFGTTVDVMEVDATSEQQTVTISGPGTGQMLEWAKVLGPGFPNVIFKLGAITDEFNTSSLNTTLWNATLQSDITGGWVGTDGQGTAFVAPRALTATGVPPSFGSSYYNATSSLIAAKIMPLGQDQQPANLAVNGSFILGTQGWDANSSALQNAGASITKITTDSEDGDNACCLVITSSTNQGVEQQITSLQARTTYQITVWVKIVLRSPIPTLIVKDITNGVTSTTSSVSSAAGWTSLSVSITTGNTGNVTLLYSIRDGGSPTLPNRYQVDNVSVYRVDPNCHTQISMEQQANPTTNYAVMRLDWGTSFFAAVSDNGVVTSQVLGYYDPVAYAYWRVRESAGFFYFDASPDNQTWQQLGKIAHSWSAGEVEVDFAAWQDTLNASVNDMLVSSLNGGSALAIQQTYINVPNVGGVFLDLLTQAQTRGSVAIITPTFTETKDSAGNLWNDSVSMQIAPGGDLLAQLQASVAAVSADWIMNPGFVLDVGLPGSLGEDLSDSVVFYESGQVITNERLRIRDSISNYIVVGDGTGSLVLASDASSIATWNQRESYIETSTATTTNTLNQIAAATLAEFKSELSQRTMTIPGTISGQVPFVDFSVGDWIGVQNTDLQTIDKVRVVAIAISIDSSDTVTVELTLETRIQLFVEQMNALIQKIASTINSTAVPAAPGAISQRITNVSTNTGATTYAQAIGDGTSTSFTIPHTFNTRNLTVAVQEATTPWTVLQPVYSTPSTHQYTATFPSTSQITITFGSAPTLDQYIVVISA